MGRHDVPAVLVTEAARHDTSQPRTNERATVVINEVVGWRRRDDGDDGLLLLLDHRHGDKHHSRRRGAVLHRTRRRGLCVVPALLRVVIGPRWVLLRKRLLRRRLHVVLLLLRSGLRLSILRWRRWRLLQCRRHVGVVLHAEIGAEIGARAAWS